MLKVNGHIHTPHSFSAFSDMEQAFSLAKQEEIAVLGINDFYSTDGYEEFSDLAGKWKIYPLFNIEFMALQKKAQEAGIRVNDPQNPGRTYLSGKGLRFPVSMSRKSSEKLQMLQRESNRQTFGMVEKLNAFLNSKSISIRLDAKEIEKNLAKNLLRERHIASAVRIQVFDKYISENERVKVFTEIFSGKTPQSPLSNIPAIENEIRNNLLKAGGPAFVEEDEKAFLSLSEVSELIVDAGGIPCYPVLLDDPKGTFTEFEANWPSMAENLKNLGIFMIELIPGRNDFHVLKDFVRYFISEGFSVTFGTEHNTPKLDPLTVCCRGGVPLDRELLQVNLKGAAVIAAHQYLVSVGKPGFPVTEAPTKDLLDQLADTGLKIISEFIS